CEPLAKKCRRVRLSLKSSKRFMAVSRKIPRRGFKSKPSPGLSGPPLIAAVPGEIPRIEVHVFGLAAVLAAAAGFGRTRAAIASPATAVSINAQYSSSCTNDEWKRYQIAYEAVSDSHPMTPMTTTASQRTKNPWRGSKRDTIHAAHRQSMTLVAASEPS